MKVYTVNNIYEADFGCEDTGRTEPTALLKLIDDSDPENVKRVEVTEKILAERGISEGKKICFTETGDILKYIRVVAAVICDKSVEGEEKISKPEKRRSRR